MSIAGPTLFTRFAYPPNSLGYCGTDEHHELLEYGASGVVDGGLRQLARTFEGAWPYLELIAHANGIADPLDARVVDAYWIGNRLAERVPIAMLGDSLTARFRGPAGRDWHRLAESVAGAVPTHAYHVFAVYPWVGLLRGGAVDHPLQVLDRCRIRWGRVEAIDADHAIVSSRQLTWDGRALALGPAAPEYVTVAEHGLALVDRIEPGDWVALHWSWICDRLEPARLRALRRFHARTLDLVNHHLSSPPPAAVLG